MVIIKWVTLMLTTLSHFYYRKGDTLSLLELMLILFMTFHFLHIMLLPKLLSINYRTSYPGSWYSTQHHFWSKNSQPKSAAVGPWSGIHWWYHGPYHPFSFTEWWNGHLRIQLQCPLKSNSLGQGRYRKLYMFWINIHYMVLSPMAMSQGPRIKGWQWEWYHSLWLLVPPNWSLLIIVFSDDSEVLMLIFARTDVVQFVSHEDISHIFTERMKEDLLRFLLRVGKIQNG